MSVIFASTTPLASASTAGVAAQATLASESPSTPRVRGDSESSNDSGLSLDSLRDALPSSEGPYDWSDSKEETVILDKASPPRTEQDYFGEAAVRAYEEQMIGADEHSKALRRYSADMAHHTAYMFETCYGLEASEEDRRREERAKAKIAKRDRRMSQPMKRSS